MEKGEKTRWGGHQGGSPGSPLPSFMALTTQRDPRATAQGSLPPLSSSPDPSPPDHMRCLEIRNFLSSPSSLPLALSQFFKALLRFFFSSSLKTKFIYRYIYIYMKYTFPQRSRQQCGVRAKRRGNPGSHGGRDEGRECPEVPMSQKQ